MSQIIMSKKYPYPDPQKCTQVTFSKRTKKEKHNFFSPESGTGIVLPYPNLYYGLRILTSALNHGI
jgi:hypothetical protein